MPFVKRVVYLDSKPHTKLCVHDSVLRNWVGDGEDHVKSAVGHFEFVRDVLNAKSTKLFDCYDWIVALVWGDGNRNRRVTYVDFAGYVLDRVGEDRLIWASDPQEYRWATRIQDDIPVIVSQGDNLDNLDSVSTGEFTQVLGRLEEQSREQEI